MFRAICAGYGTNAPPRVCTCADLDKESATSCIARGGVPQDNTPGDKGVSVGLVVALMLILLVIVALAGFVYYRYSQRRLREQVRNLMSEYMPLDDVQAGVGATGVHSSSASAASGSARI